MDECHSVACTGIESRKRFLKVEPTPQPVGFGWRKRIKTELDLTMSTH
jgi:hypothetical protein